LRAEFDPPADKAKPVVSMPVAAPREGSQLTSVVPTTISWTASDPTVHKVATGVVRTKLQVSRNGGMWKNVTLGSAAATSVVVNLTPSGSYRFRVRAFDRAGNVSAWVAGPKFRPRLLQQSQATLSADWSGVTDAALSGGSAASSHATAATASLSFYGRAISWIGSVGPGAGLAQVYVDGTLTETVDLHAATAGAKRILFSHAWGTLGSHSLRIVVLGTYGRPEVIVDAFAVFN
jgi:hypothetical protein